MTQRFLALPGIWILAVVLAPAAWAGIVVYEEGHKKVEIGGRIQLQYLYIDPENGDSVDKLFFRRLRPYLAGSVTENWSGKIQFDFGEAIDQNEVAIKDAYMRFTGFKNTKLTFGNVKPGFSREFMTSSRYLQLVGRGFAGDHNFGSPDRAMVLKYDGHTEGKKLNWSAAGGVGHHDPAINRMDFDSVVVRQADFNEGPVFVARVDVHPLGHAHFKRGDFDRSKPKLTVSAAAFRWSNDGDVNTYTLADGTSDPAEPDKTDLDSALGLEVSAGFRGLGLSADIECQRINGETVDPGFSGGLYVAGETDLDILAFDGGYMVLKNRLEVALGWDSIEADGYEEQWDRLTLGVNAFVKQHNIKFQLNYFTDRNFLGVRGDDVASIQFQAQYVF
jgi:hypothetical protein